MRMILSLKMRMILKNFFTNKSEEITKKYLSDFNEVGNLLRNINSFDNDNLLKNRFNNISYTPDVLTNKTDKESLNNGVKKVKKVKKGQKGKKQIEFEDESEEEEDNINYMNIFRHIIPLIIILTFRCMDSMLLFDMYEYIESNNMLIKIFIEQINSWWGSENILIEDIKELISLYKMTHEKGQTNDIDKKVAIIKEFFMNNTYNLKELSKLIDKYLIPTKFEERSNAEVSTPYKLRNDMLDTLPLSHWKKPGKIIEPCAGKGGLLIEYIDRYMIGHKDVIIDEELRYKTIVEEYLYFCDKNKTNIFICKLLIDPYNKYNLNYYEGDSLELDITKTTDHWKGIDNFNDLTCITNPPYNEDPNNSNDSHKKPVYQDWIYKFTKITNRLLFITPSKWFTSNDKLLVNLREYMKKMNIEYIEHDSRDDVFKGVRIKGGVSYFLINKNFNGKTKFNGKEIDISKYDIIIEPKYDDLLMKINKYNKNNLSELYCSQGTFLNSNTEKEINDDESGVVCYVSLKKGFKKYISQNNISKKENYWKVITPVAAYTGPSGFSRLCVSTDKEVHSRSYISFRVNNEEEAYNLLSYMKCKLVHVLLSLRKQTHCMTHKNVFIWIPLPPLDQNWNNEKIYKYFKLDNNDIKFIENIKLNGCYEI